jgi:hypothetical protein
VQPNRTQSREYEARAWEYRCRGWGQRRIAEQLGISQPGVSKILRRVEGRVLKELSGSVARIKVSQNGQQEYVIEEALEAWRRSQQPRKRATRRTVTGGDGDGDGDGEAGNQITTDIVERDGDPAYLYVAMHAMAAQRALWGLDVAAAMQDPTSTVAELARDLLKRSEAYEQRERAEANQAGNTGGTGSTGPG